VGEIITMVDRLVTQQIHVFALKEGLRLTHGHDLQSRVMVTLFSRFAEVERELLSLRTKEALAAVRAAGRRLGTTTGNTRQIQAGRKRKRDSNLVGTAGIEGLDCQNHGGGPLNALSFHPFTSTQAEVTRRQH
jgi:DNA invertase Pin-like site-specific DNA recombinase